MAETTLSLTSYYQEFLAAIDMIEQLTRGQRVSRDLAIAITAGKEIGQQGIMLESQTNPFTMKSMVAEMTEKSKLFGPENNISIGGKTHQYALPKINCRSSLLFGLFYLRHLRNYKYVEYQGDITTYMMVDARSKILASVADKRPWNIATANHFERQIKAYCALESLNYDELFKDKLRLSNKDFLPTISSSILVENGSFNQHQQSLYEQHSQLRNDYINILNRFEKLSELCLRLELHNQNYQNAEQDFNQQSIVYRLISYLFNWIFSFNKALTVLKDENKQINAIQKEIKQFVPYGKSPAQSFAKIWEEKDQAMLDYYRSLNKLGIEFDEQQKHSASHYEVSEPCLLDRPTKPTITEGKQSYFGNINQFFNQATNTPAKKALTAGAAGLTVAALAYSYVM